MTTNKSYLISPVGDQLVKSIWKAHVILWLAKTKWHLFVLLLCLMFLAALAALYPPLSLHNLCQHSLHNLCQLTHWLTDCVEFSFPTWPTFPAYFPYPPELHSPVTYFPPLTYPPICPTHPPDFKPIHPDYLPEPTHNLPEPTCSFRISTKPYKAIPNHTEFEKSDQISQLWWNFIMLSEFSNFDQIP